MNGGSTEHAVIDLPRVQAAYVGPGGELHTQSALCVLVVEDDPPVREACVEIGRELGFVTMTADCVPAARQALDRMVDIVLLDLKLPGGDGRMLLEEIRTRHPSAIVVVMTAYATVDSAVEALRVGVADFLPKPFTLEELSETLQRASLRRSFDAESRRLRERLRTGRGEGRLMGQSPGMEKLYRILSKVAHTTHPVLILGESGTGKSEVARAIHMNGPRAPEPFQTVDCGALPAFVESELFGGANGSGLLASVGSGTVLLDEVGDLTAELQTKLLRALQERVVRTPESGAAVPISARILAASSRDLYAMVESGRFRKDLYFRLNIVNLRVPALRERREDIPLLAGEILERLCAQRDEVYTFAADAMHLFMEYDWPGNVRELEHAIERACALSSGPVLHFGDLPTQLQNVRLHQQAVAMEATGALPELMATGEVGAIDDVDAPVIPIAEIEKQAILKTLRQLNGDKLMAARLLGIGKTTLYRKLKEYELADDEISEGPGA